MNEQGSISYFLVYVILAFILLVIFALIIPITIMFNTTIYQSAEDILLDANDVANEIQDPAIKAQLVRALGGNTESIATQVDILSTFFQYGWILIILIIVIVLFLQTRQTVELEIR